MTLSTVRSLLMSGPRNYVYHDTPIHGPEGHVHRDTSVYTHLLAVSSSGGCLFCIFPAFCFCRVIR